MHIVTHFADWTDKGKKFGLSEEGVKSDYGNGVIISKFFVAALTNRICHVACRLPSCQVGRPFALSCSANRPKTDKALASPFSKKT